MTSEVLHRPGTGGARLRKSPLRGWQDFEMFSEKHFDVLAKTFRCLRKAIRRRLGREALTISQPIVLAPGRGVSSPAYCSFSASGL